METGTSEQNYFFSFIPMKVYNTPFRSRMETRPPRGHGDPLSTFLALMVAAPGSPSSPLRGPAVDVSSVNGGCSQISDNTSQGGAIDVS
jgi:hypothetical protein